MELGNLDDGAYCLDMVEMVLLPLAPTPDTPRQCPSNTGGRLCQSSQLRPLFGGDGVPLTAIKVMV